MLFINLCIKSYAMHKIMYYELCYAYSYVLRVMNKAMYKVMY